MIDHVELRRIADANGAPEMDPLRRAANEIEILRGRLEIERDVQKKVCAERDKWFNETQRLSRWVYATSTNLNMAGLTIDEYNAITKEVRTEFAGASDTRA